MSKWKKRPTGPEPETNHVRTYPVESAPEVQSAIEQGAKAIAEMRDAMLLKREELIADAIIGNPPPDSEPDQDLVEDQGTPQSRFWTSVRARLGKSNLICPACGEPTFKVSWSRRLLDGSVLRERQCSRTECGHISQRTQPPEEPA